MSIDSSLESLQEGVTIFTQFATQQGCTFVGILTRLDPPLILVIGNVREKGADLAQLFRAYADMIDEKKDNTVVLPIWRQDSEAEDTSTSGLGTLG